MTSASPPLPLALVGCDFRVASSAWRSALVLDPGERLELHAMLREAAGAAGLAILDTCNRTEWIVEAPRPEWTADLLRTWMQRRWRGRALPGDLPRPYAHVGGAAVRHWLRVAVGMESFVPGEREIAGQCSRAIVDARSAGAAAPLIEELDRCAGRAVKRLERTACFRENARGVHSLAADAVMTRLAALDRPPIVGIAGTGALGGRIAELLLARGARVERFNRTSGDGRRPLSDVRSAAPGLDALVVATGAPVPVVRLAPHPRPAGELLVLDLGIPHQVASPVPRGVELVRVDDLRLGDSDRQDEREREVAGRIVDLGVDELLLASARRASSRLLETLQRSRSELRDERLPAILDDLVPDLDASHRRKLESALRGLMIEQHRRLVDEIERAGGAAGAASETHPSSGGPATR